MNKKTKINDRLVAPAPKTHLLWAGGIFVFAFLLYANTLGHGFVLDDIYVILTNEYVQKGFAGIPQIWTRPTWYAGIQYRPVPGSVFAIEKEFFGNNAAQFHIVNVLIYSFICGLIYLLLRMMMQGFNHQLPLIAAVLFAVHPIHTEVVANIKSLDELLCMGALIGMLYFGIRYARDDKNGNKGWKLAGAAACFAAGLLSKETALSFVIVVPMAIWLFENAPPRRITTMAGLLAFVAGLFMVFYIFGIKVFHSYQADSVINNSLVAADSTADRLATALMIIGRYLLLLVFPHPLVHDYGYHQIPIVGFCDWRAIAATVVCIGLLFWAIVEFRKKRFIGFAIALFFLTLLPASNILKLIGATMGERFLFIPSLGFCIALAHGAIIVIEKKKMLKNAFIMIAAMILGSCSIMTFARNTDWHDNLTLFSHDIADSPNSASLNASLGNMLMIAAQQSQDENNRQEMIVKAKGVLKRAVEICPDYFYALGNLALAYTFSGEDENALIAFKKAITLNAKDCVAIVNVGDIYYKQKKNDSALVYYSRFVALDSTNLGGRMRLANALTLAGRYDESIQIYHYIQSRQPGFPRVDEFLSYAVELKKNKTSAAQ
jgi:hypothetical protein